MDIEFLHRFKEFRENFAEVRNDVYRMLDAEYYAILLERYAHDKLPTSPQQGAVFFDDSRAVPTWYDGEGYERPTLVDDTLGSDVTVADTSSKTPVYSATIPAGAMVAGRVFEVHAAGAFSTEQDTTVTDTVTVHFDVGGTEVATLSSDGNDHSSAPWRATLTLITRDNSGDVVVSPNADGHLGTVTDADRAGEVNVDESTDTAVEVSISWNNAKSANTATAEQAYPRLNG